MRRLSLVLMVLMLVVTACATEPPDEGADVAEPSDPAEAPAPDPERAAPSQGEAMDAGIDEAPDFEREQMDGAFFRLSDHDGTVRVLNFWATWCMPCRVEIPEFVEMQDQYRDDGLLFVGISLDDEGFAAVEPFAEEFSVNYPQVVDDGELTDLYGGVYGLPTTFVVDRQGDIRARFNGRVHQEDLEPLLVELLNESA